jgi:hypothetical protein
MVASSRRRIVLKSLLLTGYGLSVKVQNTRLVFKQGIDPFSSNREVLVLPASACPFDKVVIQGRGRFVITSKGRRLLDAWISFLDGCE